MTADVQIVTVSYGSTDRIRRLAQSLRATYREDAQLLIANNLIGDQELVDFAAEDPLSTMVGMPGNLGYGSAINAALDQAPSSSEWILVTNPDLTYAPGAIDELVRVGSTDDTIGLVGPLIYTPIGEIYPSARKLPSLRNGIGHALFVRVWKSNPWTRSYLADREHPPRQRDAGWISGSCMLIRRSLFTEIGGFDEKFFMYFEDVDLSARAGRAGFRIVYAPSAEITHEGGHATKEVSRAMIRAHHASAYEYLASRYSGWWLWPLRVCLRAALTLRAEVAKS